ncbi:DUF7298 domain-containing protein [Streptomyces sp. NRRL F-5123]|uniref:DUF7298 domain-containing protein n=1 Tax=Streptomyces sp. NRRL F-5123 TaxID=1463856 RepID=UPI0004E268F7|nr:hypothetical protein [Streptomyces sp. NRRL F-5123]
MGVTLYPDPRPRGVIVRQIVSTSALVGNTETMMYTQTFYAEAGRNYEIHFRTAVLGNSAGDGTAVQSGRTICRWAAGSTVTTAGTLIGDVYTTAFAPDLTRASGVDATFNLISPPAGLITIGISLYALRQPASTYGSVHYGTNGQSELLVSDNGATAT